MSTTKFYSVLKTIIPSAILYILIFGVQ
jgi:hypothetical protein